MDMYVKDYYEAIEKSVASKGLQSSFTYTTGTGEDIDTIWHVDVRTDGDFLTIYTSHEGIGRGCFQRQTGSKISTETSELGCTSTKRDTRTFRFLPTSSALPTRTSGKRRHFQVKRRTKK